MKAKLSLLIPLVFLLANAGRAQTLYQEGDGLFLEATPMASGVASPYTQENVFNQSARVTYRLTDQLHMGVESGYMDATSTVYGRVVLGHTERFGQTRWGVRSEIAAGIGLLSRNFERQFWATNMSVALFRQVGRIPDIQLYPSLVLSSDTDDFAGGMYGRRDMQRNVWVEAEVPVYINVWKRFKVALTPGVGLGTRSNYGLERSVEFTGQLRF